VPEFTLTAVSPLGGYDKDHGGVHLTELTDLSIVSIALPLGGEAAAEKTIKNAFGTAAPPVGTTALSKGGAERLVRLGRDQIFALFTHVSPDAERVIAARLNASAYCTDQSDVWVALEISGTGARAALERICPIDLHAHAFPEGNVARTSMEHLGTIILRTGPEKFLLLSASSSAHSFLHALEVSIRNVS